MSDYIIFKYYRQATGEINADATDLSYNAKRECGKQIQNKKLLPVKERIKILKRSRLILVISGVVMIKQITIFITY